VSTLFKRTVQRGLSRLESLTGAQTFLWRGKEILCTPTDLMRGVSIEIGGNPIEIVLTLFVRRTHFTTADSSLVTIDSDLYTADDDTPTPVAGKQLTFRGQPYLILTAKESSPQSHFELHLADPNSGRR